ncbi:MAG TPA: penicillin-binding transpeptidase domain-containing protein [Bdellovibrionota bacterium]|jgi:cell division protein FtsI/penicillin-binding protein 2|nr:penicillin-binding transpeptidase domain-containing protein [Bdellovibrionota bacterium]
MSRGSVKAYWYVVGICAMVLFFLFFKLSWQPASPWVLSKDDIAKALRRMPNLNQLPEELTLADGEQIITTVPEYTIDQESQDYARKIFSQWKPDYGALAVMDAHTGAILTLVSYTSEAGFNSNLIANNEFPAASVFKIVTATAAIDQRLMTPDTVIPFNGRGTTLYRSNVMSTNTNRWTRYPSLRKAFGQSVNTVFGKMGIFYVGSQKMAHYAELFGFNQHFKSDLPLPFGTTGLPTDDEWSVVEAASGFTASNTLSPVHGAMLAASIVNNGEMMAPYVVYSLKDKNTGAQLYESVPELVSRTMRPQTALSMRELMKETILSGTGRKSFRTFSRHRKLQDVMVGAKSGTLDSENPKGRCDWFVGYSQRGQQKLAFAAVTVHEKFWRVKSSTIIKDYLSHYYLNNKDREPVGSHL